MKVFYSPKKKPLGPDEYEIPNGEIYEVSGEGLMARALCHELDHLDGVLYKDNAIHMLTKEEIKEQFED